MQKIKIWLTAFRLRTLPLSLAGIIAGSAAAASAGAWDALLFSLAIATTLFLQILSNLANDLGDSQKGADNENRIGPPRAVQSGAIAPKQMKMAVVAFSLLSFAAAIPLIYFGTQGMPTAVLWMYVVLAIACVIAAITYTVGKKAYGYHGLGDAMVFIFFGLVSVLGVYSLYTKSFSLPLILLAVSFGLLSTAVLNLNNLRDNDNDRAVGKRTLVVILGWKRAKFYHFCLIIVAVLAYGAFAVFTKQIWALIGMAILIPLGMHLRRVYLCQVPKQLDAELKIVALSTFGLSLLYSLSLML